MTLIFPKVVWTSPLRSSVHLTMASTVEAQTAEEAKSLSKNESCDRKPIDPASRLKSTHISTSTVHCPVQGTGIRTSRSGPD